MSVLLLWTVRTHDESIRERWEKVAEACGSRRAVLAVSEPLVEWAREVLPEFEILPFERGMKGFVKLAREVRKYNFKVAAIVYEGSKWGQAKLEALALLSGAREVLSLPDGETVQRERRLWLALRLALKALAAPFFAFISLFGWFVLFSLLAADFVSLLGRRPKQLKFTPLEVEGVSVVIPSRNGRGLLFRCLPPLRKALERWGGKWEVIVVDDASTDGTLEFLRERFPWVRAVGLKNREGFGPACNIGIREAKFDAVLLLNNDAEVGEDFLPPLVERMRANPSLLAVGAEIVAWRHHLWHLSGEWREVAGAPVVCGLFDRRKLLLLGGFDPLFAPFYWEEFDLSFRAWRMRLEVRNRLKGRSSALFWHFH